MTLDMIDLAICKCGHSAADHEPDTEGYASEYCNMLDCECEYFRFNSVLGEEKL
jgi:hypothetical protein